MGSTCRTHAYRNVGKYKTEERKQMEELRKNDIILRWMSEKQVQISGVSTTVKQNANGQCRPL
jgi:hypothetical protein